MSIDGDDIGHKIARSYIENDEEKLTRINQDLNQILSQLSKYLKTLGFEIIFCAADGIACKGNYIEINDFTQYIKSIGEPYYTFSVGIGNSLQSAFFSLKYAKASGKNKVVMCGEGEVFRVMH